MFNIGPMELMLILLVALIVVGPKRLPEVGRTIGKSLREIRKVQDEVKSTMRFDLDDEKPRARPAPRAATKPAVRPSASAEPPADAAVPAGKAETPTGSAATSETPLEGAAVAEAPAEGAAGSETLPDTTVVSDAAVSDVPAGEEPAE